MSKFAFFIGCTIPYRVPFIETSLRQTMPKFDVELVDLPFACCPDPGGVQAFDSVGWHALAARNICLAEEQGLDILTACSGCFETLKIVNTHLKTDQDLKNKVNEYLKDVDREFKGSIKINHFAEFLYTDIGADKIAAEVTNPLSGIKLASHNGCHFLKPPEIMQVDNPEVPIKFDQLLEVLGAESVPYLNKLACCGAGTRNKDMDTALKIAHEKIIGAEMANADALVTVCPTCYISYDIGQKLMTKHFEKTSLPVFFYTELLGLAMGIDLSVGYKMHTIKVQSFLDKLS